MMLALVRSLFLVGAMAAAPHGTPTSDVFYAVKVGALDIGTAQLPVVTTDRGNSDSRMMYQVWELMAPRVEIDGAGEAFFSGDFYWTEWPVGLAERGTVVVRTPEPRDVHGVLYVPDAALTGQVAIPFVIRSSAATPAARAEFLTIREAHYRHLSSLGIPGTAWFRHQAEQTRAELTGVPAADAAVPTGAPDWQRASEMNETIDILAGDRALAENLQLDRALRPVSDWEGTIGVDTIPGITVAEIDWAPLNKGAKPAVDRLASLVPLDQYAVFFRSFDAMTALLDEADAAGTPILEWFDSRSEDALTKARYQRQLCLTFSTVARLLGPTVVESVAFTGSDPFLRLGTDVAILFQAKNVGLLDQHLASRQDEAAAAAGVRRVTGQVEGVAYAGVVSQDRTVSSYRATVGDVVVVTNSLVQLAAIVRASTDSTKAMASLGEYTFFRQRYPLSDPEETALLILPDAAIRKWCSPRWRIADSRRIRAVAALTEIQARNARAIVEQTLVGQPVAPPAPAHLGKLTFTEAGVYSPAYGTLRFMTPVSEMEVKTVSQAEADAYAWFRDRYQSDWRAYFDPIAIRFHVSRKKVAADVTVMPLIAGSEYRDMMEITANHAMKAVSGDPHEEAVARVAMSVNPDSAPVRELGSFTVSMVPGVEANPLAWIGDSVSLYADADPYWDDLAKTPQEDIQRFFSENLHRLPIALYVEIRSPLKAAAFLTTVRAYMDQAAPGMTVWETLKHKDISYVRITPGKEPGATSDDFLKNLAIYYAVSPGSLTLTLSEPLLKRALERRAKGKPAAPGARTDWLGSSVGFQAKASLLKILDAVGQEDYRGHVFHVSWGNIPILNEWKRIFPDRDPVAVQEALWHTALSCPGGGSYRWNEQWRTVESSVTGHPGQHGMSPGIVRGPIEKVDWINLGLTFENDGVRARAEVSRTGR